MQRFTRSVFLAALLLLGSCASKAPELRVLSYNIHHGEGTDGVFDLERLARVIDSEKPDLVALQEVDRATERSSGVDQAAELGRLTGMIAVFGPAMPYRGGEYGDAVLTRTIPSGSGHVALPAAPDHEPRVAAWVTVPFADGEVTFVATHLDHTGDPTDRIRQAEALVERWPREAGDDVILAGDLNATPGSEPMRLLLSHFDDASAATPADTFPSQGPERRIDWVLYRPEGGWEVAESRVVDEEVASDHRPLLVVLRRRR